MKLAHLFPLLFLAFLAISCVDTRYKEPQPAQKKELKRFPKSMQGNFVDSDGDTISVLENVFSSKKEFSKSRKKDQFAIGDSMRVKTFKGYAFISILNDDNYWSVYLVDISKDFLHVYQIDPKTKRMKDLKRITEVEDFKNEEGKSDFLLLNPNKREWRKILRAEIPEIIASYRRID